jgi:hypothetical protein
MTIHVHIERLVLDGLPMTRAQAPRVQAALEAELGHLLSDGKLSPELLSGGSMPQVPGGTIRLSGQCDPAGMGRQVARALYGGIGR